MYVIRKMCSRHGRGDKGMHFSARRSAAGVSRGAICRRERFLNGTRNSRGLPDVDVPSPAGAICADDKSPPRS